MGKDGNQTSRGDHFETHGNTDSLRRAQGTNIVLWVNYTSKTQTNSQKEIRFVVPEVGGGEGGTG